MTRTRSLVLPLLILIPSALLTTAQAADPDSGFMRHIPGTWVLLDDSPEVKSTPASDSANITRGAGSDWKFKDDIRVTARRVSGDSTPWLHVRRGETEGWLPQALLAPPPQHIEPDRISRIGSESVDRYQGIDPEYAPPDLVTLPDGVGYAKDTEYRLRRPAADALMRMIGAARADGVRIRIVSGYRTYSTQRRLYLNKLKKAGWNQTTVARPGHSEHQLGTAVDLSDGDPKTLLLESFGETKTGRWLTENAPDFGFAVSYTRANESLTGYSPEPWHYRYFGPEAAKARHRAALGLPQR